MDKDRKNFKGLQEQLLEHYSEKHNEKREDQIKKKLAELGYEFETESAYVNFLKTRCNVEYCEDKKVNFYIDEKLRFWWWNTVDVKMDIEDNSIKSTIIFGKDPSDCNNVFLG